MKKLISVLLIALSVVTLQGCIETKSRVASLNHATASENFEIYRKTTFYNARTGEDIAIFLGFCDTQNMGNRVILICKDKKGIKKHIQGLNENVTYTTEDMGDNPQVSSYMTRIILRPSTLIPDLEVDLGE